jgi:flagellar biosynthesis/type III secretory pathway protein FliH
MDEPVSTNELSPLDQIRQVEAEITRRIAAAREASEHSAVNARGQAALLKKQAEEQGGRQGQILYKEVIAKAEEQSKEMIAQAQHEAENLRRTGELRMQQAVCEALCIVLGQKESGDTYES